MTLNIVRMIKGRELTLQVQLVGRDIQVLCSGGDRPHIGAVSLASPYLRDGVVRSSVSTLTVLTHREDMLSRQLADLFCRHFCVTVAASCGVHFDEISPELISQIQDEVMTMADELVSRLQDLCPEVISQANPDPHG